jgi:hypothetical protein
MSTIVDILFYFAIFVPINIQTQTPMKPKQFTILLLYLMGLNIYAQTKTEVLTNETITALVQKGLGSTIIINKIKTSKTNFDVSTDALIKLKESNVPDEIVAVMVDYAGNKENTLVDLNNPLSYHNSGIYYFNPKNSLNRLSRIDPTVISSNKNGSVGTAIAQRFSYGIASSNNTSIVSGPNARKQIHDAQFVFYFYFDKSKGSLNNSAYWWFTSASSPNEFTLVRFKEKKDSRELITGQSNAYSSNTGISEKQKIPFDYTEVGEGIYKVTLRGDIKTGEYCFLFTGAIPSAYANDKVFDFGIY